MKTTLCLFVLVGVSTICILGTSLLDCPTCSEVQCREPAGSCQCGNYTTHCGCCHRCFKCAGEVCKPRLRDICQSEYECNVQVTAPNDPDFDVFGTCTYIPTTRRPRPEEYGG
ncbi:secreted protein, putative [Ixodes scapularis]|uniref:Secreted protein, putative n=1 Tax=Ixodes scapularis TaxID=6945 RepID=B7Q7H8_IXOSC|nr:secreted protein, putative [Ixodes scapularis]|eukprot:XP_002404054.1 secreted protein, putative [Ixodes scapularis]